MLRYIKDSLKLLQLLKVLITFIKKDCDGSNETPLAIRKVTIRHGKEDMVDQTEQLLQYRPAL